MVSFVVGPTMAKIVSNLELDPKVYIDTDGASTTYTKGEGVLILFSEECLSVEYIAHECVHAANYVLVNTGIKVSTNSDEAHAFLVGHLTGKILSDLTTKGKYKIPAR